MSQTHTIVVRFPEGIVPRYSAATEFQGGQVVAVDFDGNRLHIAQELEEALERFMAEHRDGAVSVDTIKLGLAALRKAQAVEPKS